MEIGDLPFKAQTGEVIAETEGPVANRADVGRDGELLEFGAGLKVKATNSQQARGQVDLF